MLESPEQESRFDTRVLRERRRPNSAVKPRQGLIGFTLRCNDMSVMTCTRARCALDHRG
jgi:hypothetical protein